MILGSGLGAFASQIDNPAVIEAADIPHYPRSTVAGHAGRLVAGTVSSQGESSVPLLLFQGRIHFYETGTLAPVLFPVRLAHRLGVTHLLVTNAAGGINRSFRPGQLMLISDFLSLTFLPNDIPTAFPTDSGTLSAELQSRGRSEPFSPDPGMARLLRSSATKAGLDLATGTYCWLKGPSYETAAEIQMLERCGVDAVGMSTVPEISEARRLGMCVAGVSLISNLATGLSSGTLPWRGNGNGWTGSGSLYSNDERNACADWVAS